MDAERLIDGLSASAAYSHEADRVEVRQTHISIVFLAGAFVYKLRKPVALGFLDFTTLERRHEDCVAEVELGRRLAPDVYLGVVPVVSRAAGLAFEGDGQVVEWAVKMRRLPDEASLLARLGRGELTEEILERVAARLAVFHREAGRSSATSALGRFDAVARNARENLDELAPDVGVTVSSAVLAELRRLTEVLLGELQPVIERRATRGKICEGHGDLRLEHIYIFPDRAPPNDLVIIDCVEFSKRFRTLDPVCDIAFTVMELVFHGRRDLARSFEDFYFRSAGDEEGRALLPFYVAYRSLIRAKVRGLELHEPEIPDDRRRASAAKARAHALLALGELAPPRSRPVLILVGGLPGTGKSTLARAIGEELACEVIRSDVVRKERAAKSTSVPPEASLVHGWRSGLYAPEETIGTYDECRRRAFERIFEGARAVVDATFADESRRRSFVDAAAALSVPVVWFVCRASEECVRERLASRRGDASDADFAVYEKVRASWAPPGPECRALLVEIDTEPGERAAVAAAMSELRKRGVA